MLTLYHGEFLISTVPMELSLNFCSHLCHYCFANLNSPKRKADVPKIMRMLSDLPNRKVLEAKLLREGYPTVFSNLVDPFATSNYRQSIPILEVMRELGLPLQIQTKGGRGIDEALPLLGPSVWYISVAMLDDDLRRKIEPGAPDIDSRFALMERLRAEGHRVVLGLNPCVPEWLPEGPEPLLDRAFGAGAEAVWIERLHLNYKQEANIPERGKAALTRPVIDRSKKRVSDPEDLGVAARARFHCDERGVPSYSMGQPFRTDFFLPWRETYAKGFPVMQDFINHCHDHDLTERLIPFDEFADFMAPKFPAGKLPIDSYVGSTAHNLWWDKRVPPQMTFRQLLELFWRDLRTRQNPARWGCFAYAAKWDGDGWLQYVDSRGLGYLLFDPEGFSDHYAEADLDAEPLTLEEIERLVEQEAAAV